MMKQLIAKMVELLGITMIPVITQKLLAYELLAILGNNCGFLFVDTNSENEVETIVIKWEGKVYWICKTDYGYVLGSDFLSNVMTGFTYSNLKYLYDAGTKISSGDYTPVEMWDRLYEQIAK